MILHLVILSSKVQAEAHHLLVITVPIIALLRGQVVHPQIMGFIK